MLIDSHIHIALDGIDIKNTKALGSLEEKEAWIRKILKHYKEKKIFMMRDGGDLCGLSSMAREIAKEVGIIYKTPLYALYKKGHYGTLLGKAIMDLVDFRIEFQKLVALKPDHLKVPLTGLVCFDQYGKIGPIAFTKKELAYMTAAAHDQGLAIMVHANGAEAVQMAIEAGVDTLEHGYFMTERELQGLAEKDIVWVPTLAPLGNLVEKRDERFLKEIPIIEKTYRQHQELFYRAVDIGVRIAVGSDAGAYGVLHGSGFFDEISHMVKAGLSEKTVYEMACENGIKALQIKAEEIQSIENEVSKT
ncbi:amidohydrolase family protein [Geosporobacter ferrireducens]|uniref:amidohydrolase family protein n=1 Tax=Geosporobacter ferrireducens TaxID=1424294 RepID=UPI00139D6003|nr:amidohydrolase family protein [Geosporobacter ferrireducens]MTI56905.1 amidohydrolase family protein [Geosporobacter ferrireducens]